MTATLQIKMDTDTWWRAVFANHDFSEKTQHGLVRVYQLLGATTATATLGAWFQMQTHQFDEFFAFFAMMCSVMALCMSSTRETTIGRVFILFLFGFFQGVSLSSLVETANVVDDTIVPLAFGGTVVLFAALSVMALFSRRRSYLYLGAGLFSALAWIIMLSLVNVFLHSHRLWVVLLWSGLGVFFMFVLFDSQLIVEKIESGDEDHVRRALDLFVDLVSIFRRIVLLLKDSKEKEKKRRD